MDDSSCLILVITCLSLTILISGVHRPPGGQERNGARRAQSWTGRGDVVPPRLGVSRFAILSRFFVMLVFLFCNSQDTGVTPLLFTRSAMGFLTTTENQDLSLTSHPKDSVC